jgi:hypothetical protein
MFLENLSQWRNKVTYARITKLTFDELPIENIEGYVTSGTLNLDGDSALRRTCNLTLIADIHEANDYAWALNTKFKLEIGVENLIDDRYPPVIWFNYGVYIITQFSSSRNTNSITISISGQDKMCLLNGTVGGTIPALTDFGSMDQQIRVGNEYIWKNIKLPIKTIIREMIHTYAKEPF